MQVQIFPSKAKGTIIAPPSKSMSHRFFICAALANKKSIIHNVDLSEDVKATLDCLELLGSKYTLTKKTEKENFFPMYKQNSLLLKGFDIHTLQAQKKLDCKESGSTLRFLIPLALLSKEKTVFLASKRLLERPLSIYEKICFEHNLLFVKKDKQLIVKGPLKSDHFIIPGDISSQFVSGLLFALPLLKNTSKLTVTAPIESSSYIEMTIEALSEFGISIQKNQSKIDPQKNLILMITGNQTYKARETIIEGDYSNAAFFSALNFLDGQVDIKGLDPQSKQGDKIYENLFKQLISLSSKAIISLGDCPDLGPILFALASALEGAIFKDTKRLSLKESNRNLAMAEELKKFGIKMKICNNSIAINSKNFQQPKLILNSHNDHRIVMALSILASTTGGTIDGIEAVNKSFPNFFKELQELGINLSINKR